MPSSTKAFALYREAMEAGIAAVRDGVTAADIARAENEVFRREGLGDYVTDEYTRVRGHGVGLFADTKPHILEDVTTRIDDGHDPDRASQHLSSGGRLSRARRRGGGDRRTAARC